MGASALCVQASEYSNIYSVVMIHCSYYWCVMIQVVDAGTPDGPTGPPAADLAPSEVPPPPRPGVLTVLCTFITTLFTSLLPQQQPELQFQ